jgi:hypothetical protein
MKLALCILGVLCLFAAAIQGEKQKKPRVIVAVPSYYSAETFIELSESDRQMYVAGLMDGFYASALFGASDETIANLSSCTKPMDTKQISAIITKYLQDHPENWHLPLSVEAHNALNKACPGGLRVIAGTN